MIASNDLRIGNWVNQNAYNVKNYVQISGYHFWHYMFPEDAKHIVEISQLEPIPLTTEILEKCGFEKEVHTNEYFWKNDLVYLSQYLNYLTYDGNCNYLWSTKIEYLHQLQNLYYALTQKELEIKL